MFGFFRTKPVLSREDTEFQIATYKWLLKNYGGKYFYGGRQLILPTPDFFPSEVKTDTEVAEVTFNEVKKYAGMKEWPCKLVRQEDDVDISVAPAVSVQNAPRSPLGTFAANENGEIQITYNPSLLRDPSRLVATYAHELAHYLAAGAQEPPPGGWDNQEFAADLTATFLGFGVFMANSAVNFQQFTNVDSQGWQYSRSGYLSEAEHIFSLAIFLGLLNTPLERALPHLKRSLRTMLRNAAKQVSEAGIIEELSAIQYAAQEVK